MYVSLFLHGVSAIVVVCVASSAATAIAGDGDAVGVDASNRVCVVSCWIDNVGFVSDGNVSVEIVFVGSDGVEFVDAVLKSP